MVLIGRLICGVTSIAPSCSDTRYTSKENSLKQLLVSASKPMWIEVPPPFTLVHNHHWLSYKQWQWQQPKLACYKQISKLLPGTSQPRRVKATIDRIYTKQFKCVNTIPTILYMSNSLICGYITGSNDKRIVTSCVT